MTAEAFGMMATVGYALAAVFAALSVAIYITQHIKQVRDDLTGRTAERAIARLRDGSASRSRFFGGESRAASSKDAAARRAPGEGSGSLRLRRVDVGAPEKPTGAVAAEEAATTMLSSSGTDAIGEAESATTLLSPAADATAEGGEKAPETPAATGEASGRANDEGSEAATTLLSAAEDDEEDEDERGTVLLSKGDDAR